MNKENVYEPEEDTYLLLDTIKKYLADKKNLKVCEVGVGSGEIISNLEKEFISNKYFGSDINRDAILMTKEKTTNVEIKEANLLEPFKEKFDLIYFNTPYLPCEDKEDYRSLSLKDKAIYGGKEGYEVIEQFILEINDKLSNEGVVFMLCSSLSKLEYMEILLSYLEFRFEKVSTKSFSFEELIVLKITKSDLLKEISGKGVSKIRYLDSGKHSKVLDGIYNGKEVIIKIGKPQHLEKEEFFMKKIKGEKFAPEFYFAGEGYVVREKLNGVQIRDFIEESNKEDTIKVLSKVLDFCFQLDNLGINKFEMTNPYKHIFIDEDLNCKMIDYERCTFTKHPKNATQFLQYIKRNIKLLKIKEIEINSDKILKIGKDYSTNRNKFRLEDLFE